MRIDALIRVIIAVITGFFVSKAVFLPAGLTVILSLLFVPVFLIILFLKPLSGFIVFLLIRPLLDPFRYTGFAGITVLSLTGVFLAVLMVFLILTNKKIKIVPPTPIKSMYLFLALASITVLQSKEKFLSFESVLKILTILGMYFLSFNLVKSIKDARLLIRTVVYSSAIPIGVGLFQIAKKIGIQQGGFSAARINSVFVLSNVFAIYLATVLILSLYLFLDSKVKRKEKTWLGFLFLGGLICLIKTYTVSAWLMFFSGILIVSFFNKKLLRIIIPLGLLIALIFHKGFQERIQSITEEKKYGFNSVVFRKEINKQLLTNAFPQHPVTGFGIGTAQKVSSKYTDFSMLPHSDIVRMMIETGLFGASLYLFFMFSVFIRSVSDLKNKRFLFYDAVFFSIFTGYMVLSLGSNTFFYVVTSGYMFCCFGIWDKLRYMRSNLKENDEGFNN